MSNFKAGDQLKEIYLSEGGVVRVGENAHKIEVVMENGQMAGVPWFEVYDCNDNLLSKWNAALVEGVKPL